MTNDTNETLSALRQTALEKPELAAVCRDAILRILADRR